MAMVMCGESWTSDAQEKNYYLYLAGGISVTSCLPYETDYGETLICFFCNHFDAKHE